MERKQQPGRYSLGGKIVLAKYDEKEILSNFAENNLGPLTTEHKTPQRDSRRTPSAKNKQTLGGFLLVLLSIKEPD